MPDPLEPGGTDLVINSVTAPLVVAGGQPFTVNVNVTAGEEDFEDGVSFRLLVFACGCQTSLQPQLIKGSVQSDIWPTPNAVIPVTFTAGTTFDVYDVRALLLEGPKGLPDDLQDFNFSADSNPVFVI